jgi:hypothetical protein
MALSLGAQWFQATVFQPQNVHHIDHPFDKLENRYVQAPPARNASLREAVVLPLPFPL